MSIGRPIGNTRMYVLDERMEPVPVGVSGELWIGGAGLARGYLGRPDQTAEQFLADPYAGDGSRMYRSGDRARYRRDGRLECVRRADGHVKIRGFRLQPAEIATPPKTYPRVLQALVLAIADPDGEKALAALVIAAEEQQITTRELREYLGVMLPAYMI